MTDLDWFVSEYIDTNDDADRDKCIAALRNAIVEVMDAEMVRKERREIEVSSTATHDEFEVKT